MIGIMPCESGGHHSLNFVDDRNRLVGYEYEQQCCEDFGYVFIKSGPDIDVDEICNSGESGYGRDVSKYKAVESPDLSNAYFAEEQPLIEDGKFRIEGCAECDWLVLFNYHNGYYSHGFKFKVGDDVTDGVL